MRRKLGIDFGHWLVDTYPPQRDGRVRVSHIKAACNALNVADAYRAVFAPYPLGLEGAGPGRVVVGIALRRERSRVVAFERAIRQFYARL